MPDTISNIPIDAITSIEEATALCLAEGKKTELLGEKQIQALIEGNMILSQEIEIERNKTMALFQKLMGFIQGWEAAQKKLSNK